jgi:hydrogenase maturation protease
MSIAVVGIGNVLLGDDGLGVHAMWRLREALPDPRIRYMDGGTVGVGLLPYLEDATHVLFLDAIDAPEGLHADDGVIDVPLGAGEETHLPLRISPHDLGLEELIRLLHMRRGREPLTVRLLGAAPAAMDISTDLTPAAERATAGLVLRALGVLDEWLSEDSVEEEVA